jgi:hypothetical protein
MQPSSQTASAPLHEVSNNFSPSRRDDDVIYQAVTIAAILMLLSSLWAF